MRDPKSLVPRRVPPVVMHCFDVQHDRRWDAIALWDQWILCDTYGQQYGPIDKQTLDTWFAEGRLNFGTRLLRIDQKKWLLAGDVYAELAPRKSRESSQSEPPTPVPGGERPGEEFALVKEESAPDAPPADAFSFGDEKQSVDDDELPDIQV